MRARRGAYSVLVETSVGKRPFKNPRHRWKCNIKIDFFMNWIDQAQE
jgi:hypothetical protein